MDIGLEIKKFNNILHRNFANLKSIRVLNELTDSNGYILSYLMKHKDEIITQKRIEEALGITRSTASIVLSRMEKNQLIMKIPLERDSRSNQIHITEKGKLMCEAVNEEISEFEKLLQKNFTDEELELFLSFIERMKKNIKEENL
ncbi:MAG: MarR family transcriptional regulator [Anaeroplasmataceae bacterium]|nr:MarR family transcriptional regulator [Anaeroplasmataceae bacterium]